MPRNKKYLDPVSLHGTTERHIKERAEDILHAQHADLNLFFNLMLHKLVEGKLRVRFEASAPMKRKAKAASTNA